MKTEPLDGDHGVEGGLTRRALLGAGLVGGGALAAGRFPSWLQSPAVAAGRQPWVEASIPELQSLMASGRLTSRELTVGYLESIASLNPLLGAVIETNPRAVEIASHRDRQRRSGHLRGPLHGIPVLVKDNIATGDRMQTTAGSLALVNSRVPGDAPIVARLRAAGAVILGKANLSEWANFRVRSLQRVECAWRLHPEPIPPELRSVRLEFRLGGRPRREPVCGGDRDGDGRVGGLSGRQQPCRGSQADRRAPVTGRDHPDRP